MTRTRTVTITGSPLAVKRAVSLLTRRSLRVAVSVAEDPSLCRYTIDDDDQEFSFSELMAANDGDEALWHLLRRMGTGDSGVYGGGAAAQFTIQRVR